MAYAKKVWLNGELIDAEKLNHIENGIYNNTVTQTTISNSTVTFSNSDGDPVFTLELPLYNGGVE